MKSLKHAKKTELGLEPCLEPGHVGRLIVALVAKKTFSFMCRPNVGSKSFFTTGL